MCKALPKLQMSRYYFIPILWGYWLWQFFIMYCSSSTCLRDTEGILKNWVYSVKRIMISSVSSTLFPTFVTWKLFLELVHSQILSMAAEQLTSISELLMEFTINSPPIHFHHSHSPHLQGILHVFLLWGGTCLWLYLVEGWGQGAWIKATS